MEYELPVLSAADVAEEEESSSKGDSKKIYNVRISPYGKADYIKRQLPSGEVQDVCILQYNADFAKGCIFLVDDELLEEVVDNSGNYAPDRMKDLMENGGWPDNRCTYCYANYANRGNVLPRQVTEVTRADFEKYKPNVIRLGKLTETGHPYYHNTLVDFLTMAKEFGSRILMPTKALAFGLEGAAETAKFSEGDGNSVLRLAERFGLGAPDQMIDLLRDTSTSLMYSMGWDKLEPGPTKQGFSDEWRMSQARKYLDAGVNASLTVVCDVTSSVSENAKRGNYVETVLNSDFPRESIRILPLRPAKRDMQDLCGGSWNDLVSKPGEMTLFGDRPYTLHDHGRATPTTVHPDFVSLMDEKMGFCGKVGAAPGNETGTYEHCDKCAIGGTGKPVRIAFPISELAPVDNSKRDNRKKFKKKKVPEGEDPFGSGKLFGEDSFS